jgi:cytochrome P450
MDYRKPVNLNSPEFVNHKYELFEEIREHHPVLRAKISVLSVWVISRYADCTQLLKDPRALRNRSRATGGRRLPFPTPKSLAPLMDMMITEDDPNHRRLRNLVREPFKPQAMTALADGIEQTCHELLDTAAKRPDFELIRDYALPLPTRVIARMIGVPEPAMANFQGIFKLAGEGFSGWKILRTVFFDMPAMVRVVRELIHDKRSNPGDDLLTRLLEAEDAGERLTEDEIVSLVFLLVVAGFETTVHLLTNGTLTLLQHPEQLDRLRADDALYAPAIEEILRFRGPVLSTKPNYLSEPLTMHGVTMPRGAPVMPLLGAANHDPAVFDAPERFLIDRTPNHHLGFGHGVHFCLGAHLARLEARIGLRVLLERSPRLALAVPESELTLQNLPGWHRHNALPLRL